ncbi:hypothetical protein ACJX0J_001214 (mitochondrion) [Zea mays]
MHYERNFLDSNATYPFGAGKPRKQQRSFPIWMNCILFVLTAENSKYDKTGTKRNKAFLADELLPICLTKKGNKEIGIGIIVIEVTSHRYLFFLNDSIITRKQYSSIAVVLNIFFLSCPAIPKKTTLVFMNRISQALLFLFLALSALISHVENSAHCERMFLWSLSLYPKVQHDALDFIGNLLALLLTEEGIGLGTDREL